MRRSWRGERDRLHFLASVVQLEASYLAQTDGRLFSQGMDATRVSRLPETPELSEQVDAFVARLSRLQDGVADKLLPALLRLLAEPVGPTVDNLNRAERFGWLVSAELEFGIRTRTHLRLSLVPDIKA